MWAQTCVIVVENLPVPFDRHVWQQALALRDDGWRVLVICPVGDKNDTLREVIEGIEIHRHPLREAGSTLGYLREYAQALFHEIRLLFKLYRSHRFKIIHVCNPPDILLIFCILYKSLGVKLIFDQHDLTPEIMEIRSGRGFIYRTLLLVEWLSFKLADAVLSSNQTFREIALIRGGKRPEQINIVHTVPDADHLRRVPPSRTLRGGRSVVVGYLGIVGPQDGLDHLVRATGHLVNDHGLSDFRVIVIGNGPALPDTVALAAKLGLDEHICFTGYMTGQALWAQLSDFDIGVIPDPVNPFNHAISMNKVFEYSALSVPSVSYQLTETMRLLGDCGTYANAPTPAGLAEALAALINDTDLRVDKGRRSKALAERAFSWDREKASLLAAYSRLVPRS